MSDYRIHFPEMSTGELLRFAQEHHKCEDLRVAQQVIGYPAPPLVQALARYAACIACARSFEEEGLTFMSLHQQAHADVIRRSIFAEYGPEVPVVW